MSVSELLEYGAKKALNIVNAPNFQINQGLIINTGVNDIEYLSAEEIIEGQTQLIETASRMFPGKQFYRT